jgi:hypothetical protein
MIILTIQKILLGLRLDRPLQTRLRRQHVCKSTQPLNLLPWLKFTTSADEEKKPSERCVADVRSISTISQTAAMQTTINIARSWENKIACASVRLFCQRLLQRGRNDINYIIYSCVSFLKQATMFYNFLHTIHNQLWIMYYVA